MAKMTRLATTPWTETLPSSQRRTAGWVDSITGIDQYNS